MNTIKPESSLPDTQEGQQSEFPELPSIPGGYIRLTHFTSSSIAEKLLEGEDFDYSNAGLFNTTVVNQTNAEVKEKIETGKSGERVFGRSLFGNYVVLIDVDHEGYKARISTNEVSGTLPNSNIVGVVARIRTDEGAISFEFKPNAGYKPVELDIVQASFAGPRRVKASNHEIPTIEEPTDYEDLDW
jgi:hypothetical protein